MKKMFSRVLALALVVALGLGLTGGAFASDLQTGDFDLLTGTYDYGQIVDTVVIKLDQPVGEVTEEEVVAAFSVSVGGIREQTLYGVNEMELHPRTVETAEVSEDGLTVTLGLACSYTVDGTYGVKKYAVPSTDEGMNGYLSNGYSVTLTTALGNLTTDLALTFSGSITDPIVDKWGAVDETATTYKYRWYDPTADYADEDNDGYPLIIWLHGQGEFGEDNLSHIAANRVTAWGEPETQDIFGGAYVLAPQGPSEAAYDPVNGGWIAEKVMETIRTFIVKVKNINPSRIYIGGCSMGGIGTWRTVLANPGFFAAAFPVCGVSMDGWSEESALSIANLPVYLIHSIDDTTVNVSGSLEAYDVLTAAGNENVHLALFDHVKLDDADSATGFFAYFLGHFSWVYAHNDIDGTEEFWAETHTVYGTDNDTEVVYTTTKPSDLGYDSFKAWLAAQVNPTPSVFTDVPVGHESYAAVMLLYYAGITNGTGGNLFEPDAPLTRAEFMTFLTRTLGITVDNSLDTGFTDVPVNSWETGSIAWGVANGLLLGYGDGTFGPEDPLTETQVNLIVGRLVEALTGIAGVEIIEGAEDVPATRGQIAGILVQALLLLGQVG